MTVPSGVKKVIFPLAIIFFFGVSWYGLYKPELDKIALYKEQPLADRAQIEKMLHQINEFDPVSPEERTQWQALNEEFDKRLPKSKQIAGLYALLSSLAESCGLENFQRQDLQNSDSTFTDGGVERSGFDIELNFDCAYSNLAKFIDGLQGAERLTEIVQMDLTRNVPFVGVKMRIRSYYIQ